MLFENDIIMIDEIRNKVNDRLEVQNQTLESKGFRLSRSKTNNLKCTLSDPTHKENVQVRIDTKVIL